MALPACVAWMVQVPDAAIVTFAPEVVQMLVVVEAKLTDRLDEAVALTAKGVEL